MDWIKQNRFLAGFLGVLIFGILAFGAFFFLSYKGYKSTMEEYENKDGQVKALEGKRIFPNAEHLKEKKALVAEFETAVGALQRDAVKLQVPLNKGLSERNLRDKMNQEAEAVATLAEAKKLGIPEEFSLGMKKYRDGAAVNSKAVALLDWEMDAIKRFVGHVADAGLDSIDDFVRDEFPMENRDWDPEKEAKDKADAAKKAAKDAARTRGRGRGRGRDREEKVVVVANPMETAIKVMDTYRVRAKVSGSYESLQSLLNKVAADDEYFTWVRKIRIENVKKDSPVQGGVPNAFPVAGAPVGPDGEPPMINAHILFGNEKMVADLFIDFVRFKSADEGAAPSADKEPAPDAPSE